MNIAVRSLLPHSYRKFTMKAFAIDLSPFRSIPALLGVAVLSACTQQHAPKVANIVVGSNVTLDNHALACEKPSDELNQIADSSGAVQKDIVAKVARREDCHDSGAFLMNGQWQVLAINEKQLRIKMRGYLGEYWVSNAQVKLSESSPSDPHISKPTLPSGPVTLDEWRQSLRASYKEVSVKEPSDGVTTFMANFANAPAVFGEHDAFNKAYIFKPAQTKLGWDLGPNVRCFVLVLEGKDPVVVLSPQYWGRDGYLYLRKLAILVDGSLVFERDIEPSEVKHGQYGVGVNETSSIILNKDELATFRKITKDSKVSIRLVGSTSYVNLKKDGIDPISTFKSSIADSLAIYDSIKSATAGHMPDQPSKEM